MASPTISHLSNDINDYQSPGLLESGLSYDNKINLNSVFVNDYTYRDLRRLLRKINGVCSVPRIMAGLLLTSADANQLCTQGNAALKRTPHHTFRGWERMAVTDINKDYQNRAYRPSEIKMLKLQSLAECFFTAMYYVGLIEPGNTVIDFDLDPNTKLQDFTLSVMGATFYHHTADKKRLTREQAWQKMPRLIAAINIIEKEHPNYIDKVELFGSLSRGSHTVGDIDINITLSPQQAKQRSHNITSAFSALNKMGYFDVWVNLDKNKVGDQHHFHDIQNIDVSHSVASGALCLKSSG